MNHLKGNVHAELCCVAAVECSYSLIAIYSSDTVESTSVGSVVHLEALLHNCKQIMIGSLEYTWKVNNTINSPAHHKHDLKGCLQE